MIQSIQSFTIAICNKFIDTILLYLYKPKPLRRLFGHQASLEIPSSIDTHRYRSKCAQQIIPENRMYVNAFLTCEIAK